MSNLEDGNSVAMLKINATSGRLSFVDLLLGISVFSTSNLFKQYHQNFLLLVDIKFTSISQLLIVGT